MLAWIVCQWPTGRLPDPRRTFPRVSRWLSKSVGVSRQLRYHRAASLDKVRSRRTTALSDQVRWLRTGPRIDQSPFPTVWYDCSSPTIALQDPVWARERGASTGESGVMGNPAGGTSHPMWCAHQGFRTTGAARAPRDAVDALERVTHGGHQGPRRTQKWEPSSNHNRRTRHERDSSRY